MIWRNFFKESSIKIALKLLSKRDRKLIYLVIIVTVFFGILDLFGVMLIGAIGSLSVTGVSSSKTGERVSILLDLLHIEKISLQSQVAVLGLSAAIILISKTLLSLIFSRKSLYFLARRGAQISSELIHKYFSVSLSSINSRSAQESIFALTSGVGYVMVGVIGVWMSLISDISLLLILGFGLFFIDIRTTLGAIIIFGSVSLILHRLMHHRVQQIGVNQSRLNVLSSQRIYEAINSYRELVVRNRRSFYANEISKIRYELADGTANISFMQNISKYVLELTLVISALLLAGYQFTSTTASRAIAVVTIFIAASTRITPAVLRIQQGIIQIKANMGQAKPAVSLMDEISHLLPIHFDGRGIQTNHLGFNPEISAEKINFGYEKGKNVLKDVSIHVGKGEFVAIVGNSGAGKTTFIDIILGVLHADSGKITISGLQPRESFEEWPGAVAYVPQDCPIAEGTIKENLGLGYGNQDLTEEMCWNALKIAHLDKFVNQLPLKLDSFVGDRGTRLSGGQRQRLGIARALITSPKFLILDEATSSLDGITEAEISESLRDMQGNVTLLVIAHRLSTIASANRIYFLEEGEVTDIGTFEELKLKNQRFAIQAELMGL